MEALRDPSLEIVAITGFVSRLESTKLPPPGSKYAGSTSKLHGVGEHAAVTGQFAGAVYGESSIPDRWLERLQWRNEIRELADLLIGS